MCTHTHNNACTYIHSRTHAHAHPHSHPHPHPSTPVPTYIHVHTLELGSTASLGGGSKLAISSSVRPPAVTPPCVRLLLSLGLLPARPSCWCCRLPSAASCCGCCCCACFWGSCFSRDGRATAEGRKQRVCVCVCVRVNVYMWVCKRVVLGLYLAAR